MHVHVEVALLLCASSVVTARLCWCIQQVSRTASLGPRMCRIRPRVAVHVRCGSAPSVRFVPLVLPLISRSKVMICMLASPLPREERVELVGVGRPGRAVAARDHARLGRTWAGEGTHPTQSEAARNHARLCRTLAGEGTHPLQSEAGRRCPLYV